MNLHVKVARKIPEATDICIIELVPTDGTNLPAFTAGSHIDVYLPEGFIRQYSLCNHPNETHRYQIAVLKDPHSRGGSQALHDLVKEGQLLEISPPKNHFALATTAKKNLLLAGGIGITPIIAMAEHLASIGAEFEMHYCAHSPERMAFREKITQSDFAKQVHFYFSQNDNPQKLVLHNLLIKSQTDCHLYVCGPKRFIDAVLNRAREIGWPEDQLHYEFFNADIVKSENDESFNVKLASSGQIVRVNKDQTITDALSAAGIDILISCEQGVCGTCLTTVLEGIPDHRDSYLTPEERAANNQFTPCCSRAKTPLLVIDI